MHRCTVRDGTRSLGSARHEGRHGYARQNPRCRPATARWVPSSTPHGCHIVRCRTHTGCHTLLLAREAGPLRDLLGMGLHHLSMLHAETGTTFIMGLLPRHPQIVEGRLQLLLALLARCDLRHPLCLAYR